MAVTVQVVMVAKEMITLPSPELQGKAVAPKPLTEEAGAAMLRKLLPSA